MSTAIAAVSWLLIVALIGSAAASLFKVPAIMKTLETVGFPTDRAWMLAVTEICGAFALVAGLWWWQIGLLGAVGVVLYFVGAVVAHLRVGDTAMANILPAVALLCVAVALLVLRIAAVI